MSKQGRSPLFWLIIVLIVGVVSVCGWYGYRGYRAMKRRKAMMADILPNFTEPNKKLPSPPDTRAFGLHLGFTSLTQGHTYLSRHKLVCKDTSIRAMMKAMRLKKLAELKKKGADAVSGASILTYRSPKERNPQIRLSCAKADVSTLQLSQKRRAVKGRLLLIYDSKDHPLRHVSFAYNARHVDALGDLKQMLQSYRARFGVPHQSSGTLPTLTHSVSPHAMLFKKYQIIRYTWSFSTLRIQLKVMSLGRWVSVLEEVEIPWPVRPDAPAKSVVHASTTRNL